MRNKYWEGKKMPNACTERVAVVNKHEYEKAMERLKELEADVELADLDYQEMRDNYLELRNYIHHMNMTIEQYTQRAPHIIAMLSPVEQNIYANCAGIANSILDLAAKAAGADKKEQSLREANVMINEKCLGLEVQNKQLSDKVNKLERMVEVLLDERSNYYGEERVYNGDWKRDSGRVQEEKECTTFCSTGTGSIRERVADYCENTLWNQGERTVSTDAGVSERTVCDSDSII